MATAGTFAVAVFGTFGAAFGFFSLIVVYSGPPVA
jgi:hypothetical protein